MNGVVFPPMRYCQLNSFLKTRCLYNIDCFLRRGRDSNPRRLLTLPAFQASALDHYATSPTQCKGQVMYNVFCFFKSTWRSRSNYFLHETPFRLSLRDHFSKLAKLKGFSINLLRDLIISLSIPRNPHVLSCTLRFLHPARLELKSLTIIYRNPFEKT